MDEILFVSVVLEKKCLMLIKQHYGLPLFYCHQKKCNMEIIFCSQLFTLHFTFHYSEGLISPSLNLFSLLWVSFVNLF